MRLIDSTASRGAREDSSPYQQQQPESTILLRELTVLTPPTPSSPTLSSGAEELMFPEAPRRAATLPVEILCFIFEFLGARRDARGLKNCASTCRLWANVALPVLYRYCGFGVFEYMPPQPYHRQNSSAAVSYSDSPFLNGRPTVPSPQLVFRQACYWRTLLLSCFWKTEDKPTLYPYLHYVENLDLLVLAHVVTRHNSHRYRVIRNALLGSGTKDEELMAKHFGNVQDSSLAVILSKMLNVLLPQISHLKSVNTFIEDDVTGCHTAPDPMFSQTITQPVIDTVSRLSRLVNLEISGQENLTPEFGKAIKALRPSLVGLDKKTINKKHTFSLRICGSRRVWSGTPDLTEELHRNKGFLDALNENSVTMVDLDIAEDWGWDLDHVSEFFLRQARTLKGIRLRGVGDTVGTWQLLDRMGRRGCRVRGLDLESRHVHHPPVYFERTAWAFKSGLLKKLKHLAIDNFQGITNYTTNYHMIDPTAFSYLLRNHLFGGKSTGTRLTPPIRTLILTRTINNPKVPEQIGAFVMHIAQTLTTLEIGYLYHGASMDDLTSISHCREQGRYKLIEVFLKLVNLKRLKAVGYAAEILLCSCTAPPEDDDTVDQDSGMGILSRPRSPARPSTPVGFAGPSNYTASPVQSSATTQLPAPTQYHHRVTGQLYRNTRANSLRLFTSNWKNTLEELELIPLSPSVFTVYGGVTNNTLMLFSQLQKLRLMNLFYGGSGIPGSEEEGLDTPHSLREMRFGMFREGGDEMNNSDPDTDAEGRQRVAESPGKITPEGVLRFCDALPKVPWLPEKNIMQKFGIAKRYIDPKHKGLGDTAGAGTGKKEKLPKWATHIANTMKEHGAEFVLV